MTKKERKERLKQLRWERSIALGGHGDQGYYDGVKIAALEREIRNLERKTP